jgi:hypothetical protein
MAEECFLKKTLESCLRDFSVIITLLKADASWTTPTMLDHSIPLKMESTSNMVREPATLAMEQDTQENGKIT